MRIRHIPIFLSFLFLYQVQVSAIDVSINSLTYYHNTPYVEIYSRLIGESVQFVPSGTLDLQESQIEFLIIFRQGETISIAEKYQIQSPEMNTPSDFWDRRRFKLDPGKYTMDLQYVDLNNTSDTLTYQEVIEVDGGHPCVSNVLLLNDISTTDSKYAFNKAGINFEPISYNLFGGEDETLYLVAEITGLPADSEGLFYKYQIVEAETYDPITKPGFKKLKIAEVEVVLESISIKDLESGNYILNFEVVNKKQESLKKIEERFAVYHPLVDYRNTFKGDGKYESSFVHKLDNEAIDYGLMSIFPRLGNNQTGLLTQIRDGDDYDAKRYYLYQYWSQYSDNNSEEVYDAYMKVAYAVDLKFASNVMHGFETDRGYIFLKYGKPDDMIEVEDEPSAPPYQIWLYNHLEETNQTGVKFLFYNPTLVTNDYTLLHSTCRGEITNPQWEIELYRDDPSSPVGNKVDARTVKDGFNRNARRYFTDF